jgi:hypothetical protein
LIGFLSFVRDNGQRCWIRTDEIAAVSENTTKVDGRGSVPCLTILLRNNVSWHIPDLTGDELWARVRSLTGVPLQVEAA